MRKIILVGILAAGSMLAFAQDKPTPQREPIFAELKLSIAQKDVEIATLRLQLMQVQVQVQLEQQPQYQQAKAQLAAAQKAAQDAAQKPDPKK